MAAEDIRYLWGAYVMGDIGEFFPKNMNPTQFTEMFFDAADRFDMEHIVQVKGRPIGLIIAHVNEFKFEPHAVWFNWATPRQILQGSAKYLDKMRRDRWGLIHVPEEFRGFMLHLCKYGIVRKVGRYQFHPHGEHHVFETVER